MGPGELRDGLELEGVRKGGRLYLREGVSTWGGEKVCIY